MPNAAGHNGKTITKITARDFRCFREVEATLAPLTLLVGENSAGKTSFLALTRALLDAGYRFRAPDFREPPYDLGTFREIAHSRGARGGSAREFSGSFEAKLRGGRVRSHKYRVTFTAQASFATPSVHEYSSARVSITETHSGFRFRTSQGEWAVDYPAHFPRIGIDDRPLLRPWQMLRELGDSPSSPGKKEIEAFSRLAASFVTFPEMRPYCSAPVRTRPLRTYDPQKLAADPEGANVPTYYATLSLREPTEWAALRGALESFGQSAGLFDELRVRQLGSGGGPFQIHIRKHSQRKKGPWRNLIDVGYGVSQILPFLTELCRPDGPGMLLLQQPEVHLHPSAQAALGSLLCRVAASGRQVVVETHSDHLMDRVRMDVRDRATELRPEDVSLLFFERGDLDARIHSLHFGETGDILDAPPGYREFFLDEVERSITA